MPYEPWPKGGCTLAEARERTADRALWKEWRRTATAHASVRACQSKALQSDAEERINSDFHALFQDRKLLAYERRGSPPAEWKEITALRMAKLCDCPNSNIDDAWARDTSDVRVFPAIKAACQVDLVADKTLSEAFKSFVLEDPEVVALARAAVTIAPDYHRVFVEGRCHPHGEEAWPLGLNHYMAGIDSPEQRDSPVGILLNGECAEVTDASDTLRDRFGALFDLLRTGALIGHATLDRDGSQQTILRSVWSHSQFYFEASTGDILQVNQKAKADHDYFLRRWIGVVLQRRRPALAVSNLDPRPALSEHVASSDLTNQGAITPDQLFQAGTLADALSGLVFKYPAVARLRKRAIAFSKTSRQPFLDDAGLIGPGYGHEEPLIPLRYFRIEREHVGPLAEAAGDVAHSEADEFYADRRAPEVQDYYVAVNARAAALFELLQSGTVASLGHASDGHLIPIARSVWSHTDFYVHPYTGDMYEAGYGEMNKRWTGIIFRSPALESAVPAKIEIAPKESPCSKGVRSKTTSYRACLSWLTQEMRKSPQQRVGTKPRWWQQATEKWPGTLSNRKFLQAWDKAVADSGAAAWTHAGAPKKQP